jgi:hypothetical protein
MVRFRTNEVLSDLENVYATAAEDLRLVHPLPTLPHHGGGL